MSILRNLVVVIDGVLEYKVRAELGRWETSTKPYLIDCGHTVEEIGTFGGEFQGIIDDSELSDILEPRNE